MGEWMEKIDKEKELRMTFCWGWRICVLQWKGGEISLTTKEGKEPVHGVASLSSHTVTNGSKGHRLSRRNGLKDIENENSLQWCDENYRTRRKWLLL